MYIFLTAALLLAPQVKATETEVDDVDQFDELETPQAEEGAALGEMEQMVITGAPVIDDPDVESKQAKKEADAAEKQLADAQKRLNEMKLYKASLAQKTKQEVVESEKRKQMAEKEKQALDAQRRKIEMEVADIQKTQRKLEAVEKAAKLKAEKAKARLAAAKERRNQKRKATTKATPIKSKRNSLDPSRKTTAQQARI
jgi:colicin import membrane protein